MIVSDVIGYTAKSIFSHRLRSALTSLGIGIGVTAVVLLTSIGEGLHEYMLGQFTQFGTNIIAINPGRSTTFGASVGMFGTVRPLTIEDAEALKRVPFVKSTLAVMQGNASVEGGGRERRVTVSGVGPEFPVVLTFGVSMGEFLPPDDPRAPRALAVLGSKLRTELFGTRSPLGERIRVGGDRYRVIGVMESKGTLLGFDLDDAVYIPVARSLEMFNRDSLFEIDVLYDEAASVDEVIAGIKRMMIARHGGEDITITTQEQMLDVLGSVLGVITFAVAALGGISLVVGGVGIFTIMTIAVRERTEEIGLLCAIGAVRPQVRMLFLCESMLLAALGGAGGLLFGLVIIELIKLMAPGLPVTFSASYAIAAEVVAILIGLAAGVFPAHRAASLDPVIALRTE